MRTARLVIAALLVLACGGGGTPPTASPAGHTVAGTLVLHNDCCVIRNGTYAEYLQSPSPGSSQLFPCSGTGGFVDIAPGTQIQLTDQSGTILGLGAIQDDVTATNAALSQPGQTIVTQCYYTFSIPTASDASFYTLKIGSRGGPSFSAADMARMNWTVALTL